MKRASKYGKPRTVRFRRYNDTAVQKYVLDHNDVTISDVVNDAVECFLRNPKCLAHRRNK